MKESDDLKRKERGMGLHMLLKAEMELRKRGAVLETESGRQSESESRTTSNFLPAPNPGKTPGRTQCKRHQSWIAPFLSLLKGREPALPTPALRQRCWLYWNEVVSKALMDHDFQKTVPFPSPLLLWCPKSLGGQTSESSWGRVRSKGTDQRTGSHQSPAKGTNKSL